MHQSAGSSSVSTPSRPRIPTCNYILQHGSLCLGAAVRGRSYCRHHLYIRIRLRKMARSRRNSPVTPVSFVDAIAIRQTEIRLRVAFAAGRIDPASERAMLWALRMARDLVPLDRCGQPASLPLKSNRINQVPINHLDFGSYAKNDSQLTENNNLR